MSHAASIQAELVKGDAVAMQGGLPSSNVYSATASSDQNVLSSTTIMTKNDNSNNDNSNIQTEEPEVDDCCVDSVTLWEVVASFSMLFLWIQRSAFGFVAFLPSIVLLSQVCLRLCQNKKTISSSTTDSSTSAEEKESIPTARHYFFLLQSLLLGQKTGPLLQSPLAASSNHLHHKQQAHGAWPPPGLVALAMLTIVALVVHPDGMTWIMLRKIR
jgi:hypothetical protein